MSNSRIGEIALRCLEQPTTQPPNDYKVLAPAEVERLLGLNKHTMLRMRKRGDGPPWVQLSRGRVG
jgi:hypothetical protein